MHRYIPYDSLSLVHFQIGIQAPKQHFFERQFCVGLLQTVCKQWAKGPGKIPKFRPLHRAQQKCEGFKRVFLPAFWATPLSTVLIVWPKKQLTKSPQLKRQWNFNHVGARHLNCNQQCNHCFFLTEDILLTAFWSTLVILYKGVWPKKQVKNPSFWNPHLFPHTVPGSKFRNFARSFCPLFTNSLEKAYAKLLLKKMLFWCLYTNLKVDQTQWIIRYIFFLFSVQKRVWAEKIRKKRKNSKNLKVAGNYPNI